VSEVIGDKITVKESDRKDVWNSYCAIVPLTRRNSHDYVLGKVIFKDGDSHDDEFWNQNGSYGNHMDPSLSAWRYATVAEIAAALGVLLKSNKEKFDRIVANI
jgi:hypothetical protein